MVLYNYSVELRSVYEKKVLDREYDEYANNGLEYNEYNIYMVAERYKKIGLIYSYLFCRFYDNNDSFYIERLVPINYNVYNLEGDVDCDYDIIKQKDNFELAIEMTR